MTRCRCGSATARRSRGGSSTPVRTPSGVPAFTITNQRSGLCLDMDISGGTYHNISNDYKGHVVQL
ncbi:hypothetical protein GCM10010508_17450 [Streptomyces naganishii JCM 4654]|uniref:Uncharacterized protein n=1 Tax=Streptomyces naganishii JCM 4654 TaxID=1306179 RepID=A0A918Y260_9ACTN|nr:hypothetical protein GCM10010508_17450 [Streptomyces naganishii JCM 4654]